MMLFLDTFQYPYFPDLSATTPQASPTLNISVADNLSVAATKVYLQHQNPDAASFVACGGKIINYTS